MPAKKVIDVLGTQEFSKMMAGIGYVTPRPAPNALFGDKPLLNTSNWILDGLQRIGPNGTMSGKKNLEQSSSKRALEGEERWQRQKALSVPQSESLGKSKDLCQCRTDQYPRSHLVSASCHLSSLSDPRGADQKHQRSSRIDAILLS